MVKTLRFLKAGFFLIEAVYMPTHVDIDFNANLRWSEVQGMFNKIPKWKSYKNLLDYLIQKDGIDEAEFEKTSSVTHYVHVRDIASSIVDDGRFEVKDAVRLIYHALFGLMNGVKQ